MHLANTKFPNSADLRGIQLHIRRSYSTQAPIVSTLLPHHDLDQFQGARTYTLGIHVALEKVVLAKYMPPISYMSLSHYQFPAPLNPAHLTRLEEKKSTTANVNLVSKRQVKRERKAKKKEKKKEKRKNI